MTEAFELWPDGVSGSPGQINPESQLLEGDSVLVRNVVRPTLTPYLPEASAANGTAVIVAPGGGFHFLAWDYEGTDVAEWLVGRGVAAFLLKYRVLDTGPDESSYNASMDLLMQRLIREALEEGGVDVARLSEGRAPATADGEQAVRLVRNRAEEWGVDPRRIGFLGFSAGAFVATDAALSEDPSARPDFVAPIYGGHPFRPVPDSAPPLFAVVAADDALCRRTCMSTAQAWIESGSPAELHVYEQGGHGFGCRKTGLPVDGWMGLFEDWMRRRGLLGSSC